MQRCLIIDGSAIIRKVTRIILADFGLDTVDAATGAEGMEALQRQMPGLVLVDAQLTDVPAFYILRHIRAQSNGDTYAIYTTLEFDIVNLQRAHAAGASDLLVKPFDRVSLAQKLDTWTVDGATNGRPNFYARLSRSELKRIA